MARYIAQLRWRMQKRRFRRQQAELERRERREAARYARRERPAALNIAIFAVGGALLLATVGWIALASQRHFPQIPLLVAAALFAMGISACAMAARRLDPGPLRTGAVLLTIVLVIASLLSFQALLGIALATLAAAWPAVVVALIALVAVWSWRLGRE